MTKLLDPTKTLAISMPALAAQWHHSLNGDMTPHNISVSSNQKAWWVCPEYSDHVWEATVLSRKQGNGCPYCGNRRVLAGYNDLASHAEYSHIVEQWHPHNELTPSQVMARSNKKVKWQCSVNPTHEWEAIIANRTVKGSGCPHCPRKSSTASVKSFVASNPTLSTEWHEDNLLYPTEVTTMSSKRVKWRCSTNSTHEWEAIVSNRSNGSGCPFCAGKQVNAGEHDIASLPEYASIVAQWHPDNVLTPSQVSPGSRQIIKWQCLINPLHTWKTAMSARKGNSDGCPMCYGRVATVGETDLASLPEFAHLIAEWHKSNTVLPTQVTKSSNKCVQWQCSKNPSHEWSTPVYARTAGNGCPHCNANDRTSKPEKELFEILTILGLQVECNRRNLLGNRSELDLYIPTKKFAIEFNGVFWHSEAAGKDRNYHRAKYEACKRAGITLFQVWEDDWTNRRDVVMRGLAHRLGVIDQIAKVLPDLPDYYTEHVGARKTTSVHIDYSTAKAFLDTHHIQGSMTGSHYVGLEDTESRLRAVLVVSKTGKSGELRIDRYATAGVVAGGFTKLLSYAEECFKPERWITFADLSISDGGLYEQTGFHVDLILKPDYMYLVNSKRVHKFNYRLKRFRDDPTLLWQEGMTESQLAALNGLVRIWDSGKTRYVKDL